MMLKLLREDHNKEEEEREGGLACPSGIHEAYNRRVKRGKQEEREPKRKIY